MFGSPSRSFSHWKLQLDLVAMSERNLQLGFLITAGANIGIKYKEVVFDKARIQSEDRTRVVESLRTMIDGLGFSKGVSRK